MITLGTNLIVCSDTAYRTRMETLRKVEQILKREAPNEAYDIAFKVLGRKSTWESDVLPNLLLGGLVIVAGALAPFTKRRFSKPAEPSAAPNGGPAPPVGNSGVTEGPPSVS